MTTRNLINKCDLIPCEDTTSTLMEVCTRQQDQIAALKQVVGTFIAWSVRDLGEEAAKQLLSQLEVSVEN